MSLYPFGAANLTTQALTTRADQNREPAITKGQAARILLVFLACALAFTVISRQNRASPAADASGLVRLAPI